MATTLSLKLSPEVAKLMPWIVAAKSSGKPKSVEWARREFEAASAQARAREQHERDERERLERRQKIEKEKRECEEREYRELQEFWNKLNVHFYKFEPVGYEVVPDGQWEEFLPSQSSQKGRRRLLSEHSDLVDMHRYGKWGGLSDFFPSGHHSVKHNCGRKPRKPWFK